MRRVLVVDDHPIVRSGVRGALVHALRDVAVGEAGTGPEALDALAREAWDLVLLDLSLPGRDGIGLLKEIKHRHPFVPVLVLSVLPEADYAVRVLQSGASGYISKLAGVDEIVKAVSRVTEGRRHVSEEVADQLSMRLARGANGLAHDRLSHRELDVLRGIGGGKTVGEMAAEMHLSVKTVSTYRARLLDKLDLRTNAQLVRYALEHRLVV